MSDTQRSLSSEPSLNAPRIQHICCVNGTDTGSIVIKYPDIVRALPLQTICPPVVDIEHKLGIPAPIKSISTCFIPVSSEMCFLRIAAPRSVFLAGLLRFCRLATEWLLACGTSFCVLKSGEWFIILAIEWLRIAPEALCGLRLLPKMMNSCFNTKIIQCSSLMNCTIASPTTGDNDPS